MDGPCSATITMAVAFGPERLTRQSYGHMKARTKTPGSGIKTYSPTTPNVLVLTQESRRRTLVPICRKRQSTAEILAFETPTDTFIKSWLTLQSSLVTS